MNTVLLRPLAYKDSSSVVNIWGKFEKQGIPQNWFSEPEYWDLIDHKPVIPLRDCRLRVGRHVESHARGGALGASFQSCWRPRRAYFRPRHRTHPRPQPVSADEDQPGHTHVALLNMQLWQLGLKATRMLWGNRFTPAGDAHSNSGCSGCRDFSSAAKQDLSAAARAERAKPGRSRQSWPQRCRPSEDRCGIWLQASTALKRLGRGFPSAYIPATTEALERETSTYTCWFQ